MTLPTYYISVQPRGFEAPSNCGYRYEILKEVGDGCRDLIAQSAYSVSYATIDDAFIAAKNLMMGAKVIKCQEVDKF